MCDDQRNQHRKMSLHIAWVNANKIPSTPCLDVRIHIALETTPRPFPGIATLLCKYISRDICHGINKVLPHYSFLETPLVVWSRVSHLSFRHSGIVQVKTLYSSWNTRLILHRKQSNNIYHKVQYLAVSCPKNWHYGCTSLTQWLFATDLWLSLAGGFRTVEKFTPYRLWCTGLAIDCSEYSDSLFNIDEAVLVWIGKFTRPWITYCDLIK